MNDRIPSVVDPRWDDMMEALMLNPDMPPINTSYGLDAEDLDTMHIVNLEEDSAMTDTRLVTLAVRRFQAAEYFHELCCDVEQRYADALETEMLEVNPQVFADTLTDEFGTWGFTGVDEMGLPTYALIAHAEGCICDGCRRD